MSESRKDEDESGVSSFQYSVSSIHMHSTHKSNKVPWLSNVALALKSH